MDENEDQRQFFRDLGATSEQAVEEVRGLEENYYIVMRRTMLTLPWTANITEKLHGYVEQDFDAAFAFARELSQAKDFQDFARVQMEYFQNCLQLSCAQAKDLAKTYTNLASNAITSPALYSLG
jgi:hypothetical protein